MKKKSYTPDSKRFTSRATKTTRSLILEVSPEVANQLETSLLKAERLLCNPSTKRKELYACLEDLSNASRSLLW